jgi:hypothetical protein
MRLVFQTSLERDISSLITAGLRICEGILDERSDDAAKYLFALSEKDPAIGQMIESHPFDAINFFGDEDVGRAFLEHGRIGVNPDRLPLDFDGWPDPR